MKPPLGTFLLSAYADGTSLLSAVLTAPQRVLPDLNTEAQEVSQFKITGFLRIDLPEIVALSHDGSVLVIWITGGLFCGGANLFHKSQCQGVSASHFSWSVSPGAIIIAWSITKFV